MEVDYKIKTFSGKTEEFQGWKSRFTALMGIKDLVYLLKGKKYPPTGFSNLKSKEQAKIESDNFKIWSFLSLMVVDDVRNKVIQHEGNGVVAFWELVDIYEQQDMLYKVNLRIQLTRTRLREDGDMDEYLNTINQIVTDIKKSSANSLPDEDVIGCFILKKLK